MTKDSWLQHEHHCRLCGAAIEKYDNWFLRKQSH